MKETCSSFLGGSKFQGLRFKVSRMKKENVFVINIL